VDEHAEQHRAVVKARVNSAPGRVVRIDLGDGRCAYGWRLLGPNVEFYDLVGKRGETVDLLQVVAAPVAFTIWVMDYAFRRRGRWELLDVVPLADGERATVDRRAKQDPISKALSIYQSDRAAGTFSEIPATAQECAGLEVAAVWTRSTWKTGSATTSTDAQMSGWNPFGRRRGRYG
jgi:hypothetical protein